MLRRREDGARKSYALISALTGGEPRAISHPQMRLLLREESSFDDFEKHAAKTVEGCRTFVEMAQGKIPPAEASPKVSVVETDRCEDVANAIEGVVLESA